MHRFAVVSVFVLAASLSAVVADATSDEWQTVVIHRLGTIRIPAAMEVQAETLSALNPVHESSRSSITIQQAGLNNLDPAALKQYFRLMISTEDVEPGSVDALSTPIVATEEDLKEAAEVILSQFLAGARQALLEEFPASLQRVSAYDALRSGYKRVGLHGPVVVWTYFIQNYDRIHLITVSYRESEADKWQAYIPSVLGSLEIADARETKAGHRSTPLADRDAGVGSQPARAIQTGDWAPVALTFILSAILTWGIGLTPPLLVSPHYS